MTSEQQKLEALLKSNEFLDHIFHCIKDGIILTDPEGRVTFINPSAERILGIDNDRLAGQLAVEIPVTMYSKRGDRLAREERPFEIAERAEKGRGAQKVIVQRSDGKTFPVLFNVGRADDGQMVAILTDISELLQKQQQMEEYFNLVAHDLRTPLTAILGHAELIADSDLSPDNQKTSARRIRQAGNQMQDLIEGITERMRIEAGNVELKIREVNIGAIVHDIIALHATGCGFHLFDIDVPDTLTVRADFSLTHRCLNNLVSNAAKYSPENSKVVIRGWDNGKGVMVTVSDRGYGIEPEDLPYIFDPFFITSLGQKKGGVGLGLHIAFEIAKLHGGNIYVSSQKDEGTTFAIYLPHRQ